MKKVLLIAVFTLMALVEQGRSQTAPDQSSELPSGPLIVAQMPKFAQWTIDYTYTNVPKPGTTFPIRPVHTLVTKTGDITHEETTFEQGLTGEMWSNSNIEVERRPNLSALIAVVRTDRDAAVFPGFDWISKENFTGMETQNGHKYLVFKHQVDPVAVGHPGLTGTGVTVPAVAYIDSETHYPLSLQFGVETRQYTILAAPTKPLVIPADFLEAGKAMMDQIQKATPHLAPP